MQNFSKKPLLLTTLLVVLGLACASLGMGRTPLFAAGMGRQVSNQAVVGQGDAWSERAASPQSNTKLTVVEADPQGVVVELTLGKLHSETLVQAGQTFQRVTIPSTELTATPGAPQVPVQSALLGVPTVAGLSFTLLATEQETQTGFRLSPAPRLIAAVDAQGEQTGEVAEVFSLDEKRYQQDAAYPGALIELQDSGYMRDQAVARVTFYPVQYNPSRGELVIYHRIRARIHWNAPVQAAGAVPHGSTPTYEALLQKTLLNYATLGRSALASPAKAGVAQPLQQSANARTFQGNAPQLKIGVRTDGVYRITFNDLVAAHFDLSNLDPRNLQISNRGQPIPMIITGEEDGHFDPDDFILFYGTGIHHDIYTITNVYWLSLSNQGALRMAIRDGAPKGATLTPTDFQTTEHAEKDNIYWSNMLNAQPAEDHWFWERRISFDTVGFPATRTYTVTLHSLAGNAPGTPNLRIRLKGYSFTQHWVQVSINNKLIPGPQTWAGATEYTYTAALPLAWLKEGDNFVTVEVVSPLPVPDGPRDAFLVNWLEVDYGHSYTAAGDLLAFTTPLNGLQHFQLPGFTNGAVTVLDVTKEQAPVRLLASTSPSAAGQFLVQFEDQATPVTHYLAVSEKGYQKPAYLTLDEPSNLKAVPPGLNYIIITHPAFYASATTLADYRRQNSGLTVETVKIDDIYDEFNFGIENPQAVRDFLSYVYTATTPTPPDYVLLFGDGTVDYRGNLTPATPNFMPTQIISSTLFGEVPSDNWFVTLKGDDILPEMAIGRLVAQNSVEAERMVTRIINYDKFPPNAPWNQRALFVADDDEDKFATNSDTLAATLPYSYTINKVYLRDYKAQPLATARNQIIHLMNQGAILVNYFGHGEHFGWGISPEDVDNPDNYIFHINNIAALTNEAMLPVVTIANCLNGAFAGTSDRPALAEELQRAPNGGAIAIWAPSSLGYPTGHKELLDRLYDAIFAYDKTRLGDATTNAKIGAFAHSTRWAELVRTYILFGDPATKIGIPVNYPYITNTNPPAGKQNVALNQPIVVTFSKPMTPETLTLTSSTGQPFGPAQSLDDRTFLFASPPLAYATTYTLTLQGQDLHGNALLKQGPLPNPWSFTTVLDSRPRATLQLLSPAPSVARPADGIRVTFSEPVLPGTVKYALTPGTQSAQFVWNDDATEATFTHTDFQVGETYTFTLATAKDVTNNSLVQPDPLVFTVAQEVTAVYLPHIAR